MGNQQAFNPVQVRKCWVLANLLQRKLNTGSKKIYDEKQKEKPCKPQFSLNFQFNFGEEQEMQATSAHFVRLRNMANLHLGRTNVDFLQVLMDRSKGTTLEKSPEKNDLALQANATTSVFQLYAERQVKTKDFGCQWPSGESEDLLACRFYLPHTTLRTTSLADINP